MAGRVLAIVGLISLLLGLYLILKPNLFGMPGPSGSTFWRFRIWNESDKKVATARFRLTGSSGNGSVTYQAPPQLGNEDIRKRLDGIEAANGTNYPEKQYPADEPSGLDTIKSGVLTIELDGGKKAVDIPIAYTTSGATCLAAIDGKVYATGGKYFIDIIKYVHLGLGVIDKEAAVTTELK